MALLIKNVTTYQKTKPLYEAYRKARNKEKYRAKHECGIILHEAAAKSLKAARIDGVVVFGNADCLFQHEIVVLCCRYRIDNICQT